MWNFTSCLSEKGDFFMRVLFCKFHCPSFICFCKPSSHIYTTGPLKLDNSPHVLNSNSNPTTTTTTTNSSVVSVSDEAIKSVKEEKEKEEDEQSVVDGKLHQNQNQNQNHNRNQPEEEEDDELERENSVRSSIKKPITDSKGVEKKRVQWMDFLGKELAEVREFDASETDDTDNENEYHRGCVCTIL